MSWLCYCRQPADGPLRLAGFERERTKRLQRLLQEEARQVFKEGCAGSDAIHAQCLKDFDRADYYLGRAVFLHGAAGREAAAGAVKIEDSRSAFAEKFRQECVACYADGDDHASCFARVVSYMASQASMAHLGSVCFSGPHAYALPAGSVTATYRVERDSDDSKILLSLLRYAPEISALALPTGEEIDCDESISFMRQSADVILRPNSSADGVDVEVVDVREAMRVAFPDQRSVVHDGLVLHFASPRPPGRIRRCVNVAWRFVSTITDRTVGIFQGALRPLARSVLLRPAKFLGRLVGVDVEASLANKRS